MSFIKVVVFRDRLNFFERKCSFLLEKTLLYPFYNRKPTTMEDKNENFTNFCFLSIFFHVFGLYRLFTKTCQRRFCLPQHD